MTQFRRVALLVESSRTYGRDLLRGIARYAHIHGGWSIFWQERELHGGIPERLKKWVGDGIIARIEDHRMARELMRFKVPVVDVLANGSFAGVAALDTDAEAVAKMAADFFLQTGFLEIAFCGYSGIPFSDRRQAALSAYLAKLGRRLLVCQPEPSRSATHIQAIEQFGVTTEKAIADWLHRQPLPLALLACNDVRAKQVLDACREHGLKVPEEVVVMGVDNDDVLCSLSAPPLTSIQPDTEKLGYEAAELLDQLMRRNRGFVAAEIRQIPPLAIVERSSTDMVPVTDPIVVEALRLIRSRLGTGIAVKDVLRGISRSRTDLEKRFRIHLNVSVRGKILAMRLNRASQLLRETELPIEKVAAHAGIKTASHLCRLFAKYFRTTPHNYRRSSRVSPVLR